MAENTVIKPSTRIQKELFAMQDRGYRDFHAPLIPNVDKSTIIGVRTPQLRKYAKQVAKYQECAAFLNTLPHVYYEENNLHSALLSILYKEIDGYIAALEQFLPYVDNWACCDMIHPAIFKKNLSYVYPYVEKWLQSDKVYTVRFAIVTLLSYYLDEEFKPEMLAMVAGVTSEDYYIKMAVAWYFSIALVKQYEAAIGWFTGPRLDVWTHNKALQKAVESYRITDETKRYLRSLKIKSKK